MALIARPMAFALLALGLAATQSALADCSVPTIDSLSPTLTVLRWGDTSDRDWIQEGKNETVDSTIAEKHFMLNQVGIMYARGRGVPKSSGLATKLFRQLAMDGYTPAMVNLGTLYEWGVARGRNHRQAYAWIRAALAFGVPKEDYDATLFKLGMIAARLSAAQMTSAERLALTIIERIGDRYERSGDAYQDTAALSLAP